MNAMVRFIKCLAQWPIEHTCLIHKMHGFGKTEQTGSQETGRLEYSFYAIMFTVEHTRTKQDLEISLKIPSQRKNYLSSLSNTFRCEVTVHRWLSWLSIGLSTEVAGRTLANEHSGFKKNSRSRGACDYCGDVQGENMEEIEYSVM